VLTPLFARTFKDEISKTNHREATFTLLKRERRRQTIHLILNGAYRLTNAELTACFQDVHKRCPSLLRYLTTPGTRLEQALESGVDSQDIQADHEHANPAAQIRVYPRSLKLLNDPLLSVRTLHNLHNKHLFLSLLRKAYEIDYSMPNIITFDQAVLFWVQRLKFTDL
jgi:hypothetical protein